MFDWPQCHPTMQWTYQRDYPSVKISLKENQKGFGNLGKMKKCMYEETTNKLLWSTSFCDTKAVIGTSM